MLVRALILIAGAALLRAQDNQELFNQAPPHIDQALRERLTDFYQASMEGRFSYIFKNLVAEDSMDAYLSSDKIKYLSFKITKINYSDNFDRAAVVCDCEINHLLMGTGQSRLHMAFTSLWKQVNGKWYWYVEPYDPAKGRQSPFGAMHKGQDSGAGSGGGASPLEAFIKAAPGVSQLQNTLRADRAKLELSSEAPAREEITLSNHFSGPLTLVLEAPELSWMKVTLDPTTLQPGETARLVVDSRPLGTEWKSDTVVRVRAEPTSQVLEIPLLFKVPVAKK